MSISTFLYMLVLCVSVLVFGGSAVCVHMGGVSVCTHITLRVQEAPSPILKEILGIIVYSLHDLGPV